jgi:hypothetical protein
MLEVIALTLPFVLLVAILSCSLYDYIQKRRKKKREGHEKDRENPTVLS